MIVVRYFLLTLLFQLLVSLLLGMFVSQIAESSGVTTDKITSSIWYILAYSLVNILIYALVYICYNKYKKIEFKAVKAEFKMEWHTYLLVISIGIISLFGIQFFIGAVDNLLELIGYPLKGSALVNPTNFGSFILATIVLAVIPAIGEELIFRGIVFNGLRSKFSNLTSILLSALLFALMHASLQQFIYPFILGVIMSWVVARTGSLIASILVHFTNNFLVVLMTYLSNTTNFSLSLPNTWWAYIVAVGLLLLTAGVFFLIDKFYFEHKNKEVIEKSNESKSLFVYIALAVGGVVLLFMTLMAFVTV